MFEAIKRESNRNYNSQEILLYKHSTRKTHNIFKEIINKTNKSGPHLANNIVINKNDLTSDIGVANEFNRFFTNIGPEFVREIPTALKTCESFLRKIDTTMPRDPLLLMNIKKPLFSSKTNKSPGFDNVCSNVIINCFSELNYPVKYLFGKPIKKGFSQMHMS